MATYLPFQNTEISSTRSIGDIQSMLEETGFDEIATVLNARNGRRAIIAVYRGVRFRFEIDIQVVLKTLYEHSSRFDEAKAARVAWRMMREQIKALCDGIKLKVISPSQAFAGFCELPDHTTIADRLATAIETGKLESGSLLGPTLLEDKTLT
jgi:hypothetical protein